MGRLLPAGLAHSKLAWVGWCAQARWPDVCPRCCDKLCGPEGQSGVFPRPGTGSSRAFRGHSRHPTPACAGFAPGSRVLHLVAPGPILQRSRPVDAGAGPTRGLASLCRGRSLLPVLGRGRADQLPVRLHCPRHLPDQGPLRAAAGSPRCVWECGLPGRGRGATDGSARLPMGRDRPPGSRGDSTRRPRPSSTGSQLLGPTHSGCTRWGPRRPETPSGAHGDLLSWTGVGSCPTRLGLWAGARASRDPGGVCVLAGSCLVRLPGGWQVVGGGWGLTGGGCEAALSSPHLAPTPWLWLGRILQEPWAGQSRTPEGPRYPGHCGSPAGRDPRDPGHCGAPAGRDPRGPGPSGTAQEGQRLVLVPTASLEAHRVRGTQDRWYSPQPREVVLVTLSRWETWQVVSELASVVSLHGCHSQGAGRSGPLGRTGSTVAQQIPHATSTPHMGPGGTGWGRAGD